MFNYILKGNGNMAVPVSSDMNSFEIQDYIRRNSRKIMKNSFDTVFSFGVIDFVNPEIITVDDFHKNLCYII